MASDQEKQNETLRMVTPELKELTQKVVRAFYGPDYFVVFHYIQRAGCIRDEELRGVLKLELKDLRKLVNVMKADMFIRDRSELEEVPGQRPRRVSYFSVDYKALLNVTRYKLAHMHDKLNSKDQADSRQSSYRCTKCAKAYTARRLSPGTLELDIGELFMRGMSCWMCHSPVEEDVVNTAEKHNSLSVFNGQLAGIFALLKVFDGVQFDRDLIEPPLPTPNGQGAADADAAAKGNAGRAARAGGVTVSLGNAEGERLVETKSAVPWLQDGAERQHIDMSSITAGTMSAPNSTFAQTTVVRTVHSSSVSSLSPTSNTKRMRLEEEVTMSGRGPRESEVDRLLQQEFGACPSHRNAGGPNSPVAENSPTDDQEEQHVYVAGKRVHIDEVTEELAAQMSPDEQKIYVTKLQQFYV